MRISDWSSDVCSSDLAVDPERAVATVFTALEAAGAEVARHRDPAVLPKAIKNDTELGGTRAAHVRDGVAVARFLKWMEEVAPQGGLDELSVAAKLRAFREQSGALVDLSFDTLSASGPNGAMPHRSEERRVGKECVSKCDSR